MNTHYSILIFRPLSISLELKNKNEELKSDVTKILIINNLHNLLPL